MDTRQKHLGTTNFVKLYDAGAERMTGDDDLVRLVER